MPKKKPEPPAGMPADAEIKLEAKPRKKRKAKPADAGLAASPEPESPHVKAILDAREVKSSAVDDRQEHPDGKIHERNGQPNPAEPPFDPGSFAARVRPKSPSFAPIPKGFMNVDSYPQAGVKVNKSLDKTVAAIQFAEDRLPTRAEKDILEAVSTDAIPFTYDTVQRQWLREDKENPGANIIDAKRIGRDLAESRAAERGR